MCPSAMEVYVQTKYCEVIITVKQRGLSLTGSCANTQLDGGFSTKFSFKKDPVQNKRDCLSNTHDNGHSCISAFLLNVP